jgi:translation initiation factor 2B subunit (eIF-2B alpha/beta/delta family)
VGAVEQAFADAAADRDRGAAAVERRLLERLVDAGPPDEDVLRGGARTLREEQPAMANLVSLAGRAESADPAAFLDWACDRLELLRRLSRLLAEAAWPFVRTVDVVVTVSRSSAVAAVLRGAVRRGWRGRVVVFDGAPSGRGPKQARELVRCGVDAVSQPDAVAPGWLEQPCAVVVGADAIGPTSFVNASGTALLLEAARRRGRPALLVADRAKEIDGADLRRLLDAAPCAGREGSSRRWPVFEEIALRFVDVRADERGLVDLASGAGSRPE